MTDPQTVYTIDGSNRVGILGTLGGLDLAEQRCPLVGGCKLIGQCSDAQSPI